MLTNFPNRKLLEEAENETAVFFLFCFLKNNSSNPPTEKQKPNSNEKITFLKLSLE